MIILCWLDEVCANHNAFYWQDTTNHRTICAMGKIIAIVGMTSSGKGSVTTYLEEKGYPRVHFGTMVYDEVRARGLDLVADERYVREDMRIQEGNEVLAVRAAQQADTLFESGHTTVVFDGLYSWSEYKYLHGKYGDDLIVVCVFTPRALRHERGSQREDGLRRYTTQQLAARDIEEIEHLEKGGPIAIADHVLLNTGSLEKLHQDVDELIAQLGL